MRVYVRKVASRAWLTDDPRKSRQERIMAGAKQFRDQAGKPSVYEVSTPEDRTIAIAAVAWEAAQRQVEKMRKADFVVITDEHLQAAALTVARTPTSIPWPVLRGRHFELTKDERPCDEQDIARLVRVLIDRGAEHGRFTRANLQSSARSCRAHGRIGPVLAQLHDIIKRVWRFLGT